MKFYILTVLLFLVFNHVSAQRSQPDSKKADSDLFRITVPIKNDFNDRQIKSVFLLFRSDTLCFATIIPDTTGSTFIKNSFLQGAFAYRSRFYDLGFEGDYYVFKHRYPQIQIPTISEAQRIKTTVNSSVKNLTHYAISEIQMYADSTTFVYTHGHKWNEKSYFGFPAKYNGNLKELEERISRDLASSRSDLSIDSVLVYEAVISLTPFEFGRTSKEEFKLNRLLFGKESIFSALVAKNLNAKETNYYSDGKSKWTAAILGTSGRPMETKIKIYVALNKDGSVAIKLPRMLGNFTGD